MLILASLLYTCGVIAIDLVGIAIGHVDVSFSDFNPAVAHDDDGVFLMDTAVGNVIIDSVVFGGIDGTIGMARRRVEFKHIHQSGGIKILDEKSAILGLETAGGKSLVEVVATAYLRRIRPYK